MKHAFKALVDEFTIHLQSESKLVDYLEKCFEACTQQNLCPSAKTSMFFIKEVNMCGRINDSYSYQLDPHGMEAIRRMEDQGFTSELRQFIYCCQ